MARKLKVFRTPIGFHDAYVAAPSQKAALEAWGSDVNLFARAAAEEVTDPASMEEPLANPGKIIRRPRGSPEQHLAALPPNAEARKDAPAVEKRRFKPKPRPSRAALDKAEGAMEEAGREFEAEQVALRSEEQALRKKRAGMEAAQAEEERKLTQALDRARAAYEHSLEKWRRSSP